MKTDPNATPTSVAELYRLASLSGLDAETLVRYAAGDLAPAEHAAVAARLAAMPQAQALADLLTDLAPDSATLATAIGRMGAAHHVATRSAPRRAAATPRPTAGHGRRRTRGMAWFGAAAVLAMAFGLWGWHHHDAVIDTPAVAAQPASDSIFGSGMDHHALANNRGDEIFHAEFRSDDIFRSNFNRKS